MSQGLARPLTPEDFLRASEVVHRRLGHYRRVTGRSWLNAVDPAVVVRRIVTGEVETRMLGGILVCFQIGSPWYTDQLVLQECMCLRIAPCGDFHDVPLFLEAEARARGCAGVGVATALASGQKALIRHYEAAGFSVQAHELYKELV